MSDPNISTIDLDDADLQALLDEDFDNYLSVVFAVSAGTANVSAEDRKKLHPLMRYYAKKAHPFTACVRDNRKRFGAKTEAYCAVLKDLIVGNTNWRGKGKKYTPRALSEEQFSEEFSDFRMEFPEGFTHYLSELTEDDIKTMTNEGSIAENMDFAQGDVAWKPSDSYEYARRKIEEHLNSFNDNGDNADTTSEYVYAHEYWVKDISPTTALVCYKGDEHFAVPYKMKGDNVVVSEEENWTPVENAWIETNLSDDQEIAELFFSDSEFKFTEENGLIWKPILREGSWKYSPGPGQIPVPRTLSVVKEGPSDRKSNIISMAELLSNFRDGVIEHVTVPTSHADKVSENTGFVKDLRLGQDENGRAVLEAGIEFTEPEIRDKVKRGTIVNTSGGVLFDYVQKEAGKRYNSVLGHVALTHKPWLNGLGSFSGVNASENLQVVAFSEENSTIPEMLEGGETVSTTETEVPTTPSFFDEIGLSEDEVKARLSRFSELETENKKNRIDAKCNSWQSENKSPAVIKEAKALLMGNEESITLNLSEEGATQSLSLSEIVERLVKASPSVNLTNEEVTDQNLSEQGPEVTADGENAIAKLSHEKKVEFYQLTLEGGLSAEEALARVSSN